MKRALILASVASALLFVPAASCVASTLSVSNPQALYAAVKASSAGDTILLRSGDYGVVQLDHLNFPGAGLTVKAAPGAKPVMTSLVAKNSKGLNFAGLEIAMAPKQQYGMFAIQSERISFDNMTAHQADGSLDGVGFFFRLSNRISVTNSEFHHLGVGGSALDTPNVTVSNNRFHDINTDGVDLAGSPAATVTANTFTDFFPGPGAHPDAIQFWGTKEHPMPAGSVVKDNIIRRGKGRVMQGIFVESQSNITIVGNAMSGTMTNGISVSATKTADIRDNFVQGYRDMGVRIIARGGSSNITVSGNVAPLVVDLRQGNEPGTVNFVENKTSRIRDAAVGDDSAMDAWLAKRGRKP